MSPVTTSDTELRAKAEELIFEEGELLDGRLYGAWLELYVEDAHYWIPSHPEDDDPDVRVSIVYDDRDRLAERIARLESGDAYAQIPTSRTCHVIGALRVGELVEGETTVVGNQIVAELRRGTQTLYPGKVTWTLRSTDDGLRIAGKRIDLIASETPLGNLSFIL